MPFGIFDSNITKKGYVTSRIDEIWSERATVQGWYDVESALALTQAELRLIPGKAAQEIAEAATVSDDLITKIASGQAGNPFALGLDALRAQTPKTARPWVHFGATTQDILDTGRATQVRASLDLVIGHVEELLAALADLAEEHSDTLMTSRTNGQHAIPTTLGMRVVRWIAELRRTHERLIDVKPRALLSQFSGAGGTYASMGESKLAVPKGVSEKLGLSFEVVPWHASRDSITELCCSLAIYGQTLAKIAEDLYDMQRTDIAEAIESMDPHLSGSSTMPQKRNPFATMKISAAARIAAAGAAGVLTQPPGSFERDHRQLELERDTLPRVFAAIEGAGAKLIGLLPRIQFDTAALDRNVRTEGVLVVSEGIMMALAPYIGHESAHDLIQAFAGEHRATGISLSAFISKRGDVAEAITEVDLIAISQPESYTGMSGEISRQIAIETREYLGTLA